MLVVGIVLLVVAAVLGLGAVRLLSRANRTTRLSWWATPPGAPARAVVLRLIGVGLAVLGAALAAPTLSFWAVLLFVAALVPQVVIIVRHNRRVASA